MKQQVYNTFLGLAALSIIITLAIFVARIFYYIHSNYIFNPLYFGYFAAAIMLLVSSNLIGQTINNRFKRES